MRCTTQGLIAAGVSALCALSFGGGVAAVMFLAPSTRGYASTQGTVLGGTVTYELRRGGSRRGSAYGVYVVTWQVAFTPGGGGLGMPTAAPTREYVVNVKDARTWVSAADAQAVAAATKTITVYYDARNPSKAAAVRRGVHSAVLPLAANTVFCLILALMVLLLRGKFCSMKF